MLEAARKFWRLGAIEDLVEYANANPAPDFSRLAPGVVALAEQGDAVAREVVQQGGRDLAMLAGLVIERMRGLEGPAFEIPEVAVAGSILERVASVRDAMIRELRRRYAEIIVREKAADPAAGALWRARKG